MTVFGLDELPVKPRMRGWIHLYAFGVSVVCGIVLVVLAYSAVSVRAGLAITVYAVATCGLFGVSATYHRVHWQTVRSRTWMKRADHSMIFLFIAGSYTPFAVLGLPSRTGTIVLIVVWAGALAGVTLKMLWPTAPRWLGVPLYLVLGWAIVPVAGELTHRVGVGPMALLVAGGVFYSIGAILYATKWPNPWPTTFGHHEFFHAATVVAAVCHYIAVWLVLFT
ncbi:MULTISPECIES: PAQR family membrane homeostasis protein TrhA [unclassified Rhodococcus (in: high G+C Gram-positive bacteria)]|uniref:PAQR family membrane homeostasis protein TrhA n=1 Tax=unclassified Rhodococcus (in: high G+C Gram-positive bacteria) TaxID=192944 RepID=UPI00048997BE|nr:MULTISPECIES: hemolysin III family protein [unclassified Rhodococcus (in: high G+C Gram-positive bacteria)]MBY6677779.1 hemolysin III family protein [Rhodococcus sp. BP-332]MDQ1202395.1 hemolysin III [Rhodococcus sp. SORGH_AS_0303]